MPVMEQGISMDGQDRFDGGCFMRGDPPENGYRYAENIDVRTGDAETRPGIRRAFRSTASGFKKAFYFNEDGERYNDASHTGFWFPFDFVGSAWTNIQGLQLIRFPWEALHRIIIVSNGDVFVHDRGIVQEIPVAVTIATTEQIEMVQANQYIIMLRGDDNAPLWWDGGVDGFVEIPDTVVSNKDSIIPSGSGEYIDGRLWLTNERDDIYASDVLGFTEWDYTNQTFGVNRGDGDQITRLVTFHEDALLVFKYRKVYVVRNFNTSVLQGTKLSDYVTIQEVDSKFGLIAPQAVAVYGEQVAFLSYRGICTIARNQQNRLEGREIPLSADIQPLIDRINWPYSSVACAAFHDNYLFFAVPFDGATHNNVVLVYDLLARQGQGAWLPIWRSELLRPVKFFPINEALFFLGDDGQLRQMLTNDPWDSDEPLEDAPLYDAAVTYFEGEHVLYTASQETGIYRCIADSSLANAPTDTDYWELEDDPQNLFRISTELITRPYRHQDQEAGKALQRGEVTFAHQDPKVSIEIQSEAYATRETMLEDKEYYRTVYDVADTDDWDPTNVNLDFATPNRQDYSVFLSDPVNAYPSDATADAYVSSSGSNTAPSDTWAKAATDIQTAIDAVDSGGVVLVDDGTWVLSTSISVLDGKTLKSKNGPTACILTAQNVFGPVVTLNSDTCMVKGFTITGGGVAGVSTDGGVSVTHGILMNCIVTGNNAAVSSGVRLGDNTDAILRNCLIYGNTSTTSAGGVLASGGGIIESCTISGNTGVWGLRVNVGSIVRSSIIYGNTVSSAQASGTIVDNNSCFPTASGSESITSNPGLTNYRLGIGSPCIEAGDIQSWMTGAFDVDGKLRVLPVTDGDVDMGCFEFGDSPPSLYIDDAGIDLNIWTTHSFRFMKRVLKDRSVQLRITNEKGKMAVKSVRIAARVQRHTVKEK